MRTVEEIALSEQADAESNIDLNQDKPLFEPMTDDDLIQHCKSEIASSTGGSTENSDGDEDVSLALDYYYGRLPTLSKAKSKDKNASRFVSQDVMDGIEATVAEIMPAFVTDEIGFYEPEDERDEDSARAETDIVNYLFMEEYDGYTLLVTAIKDALLHRNCTVKAFWDERVEVEYETFEDVPELALAQILQPTAEDQTVEVIEQDITEEADPEAQQLVGVAEQTPELLQGLDPAQQQQASEVLMQSQAKYTIKIKRTTTIGRPVIMAVPPEQVRVNEDHTSPYLHNCRFCSHESLDTRSSLIAQGFDQKIVMALPEATSDSVISESRNRNNDTTGGSSTSNKLAQLVEIQECYLLVDFDGDGIAERRKVVLSGEELLSNEEWDDVNLIGGAAGIIPHKYKGLSMFDRLKAIQDAKTPIVRAIIDGTMLSSNPRLGVITGEANLDDILTSRTGGIVRADRQTSVFELPNPQVPQSSYSMLQFMDGIRRERGGGAIDSASQAQSVSGDTAHGIERVMSVMELSGAMLARTIGETIVRGIFIQLHNIIRKNHKGMLQAKVGGKWVSSMPSEWKKRTHVSIQVGSSHAERARQSNLLTNVIGLQKELAANQSPMFSEEKSYTAITDAIRLGGIKSPDRYFVDPTSEEGKAAAAGKAQQSQEMQAREEAAQAQMLQAQETMANAEMVKGQADMQNNQVKAQNEGLKNQIQAMRNEMEAMQKAGELKFKYDQLEENSALKLTELEAKHSIELNKARKENRGDASE